MKKIIPAYILSFVISFTFFIYEPVILYASNKTDLWFDFMTMLKPMFTLFFTSFVILSLIYTLINKLFKNNKIYNVILVISFIIYFASYIQGNYLLKSLPGLDGTTIVWDGFLVQNIITIIIWLIISITYIITTKKYTFEKVLNISSKVVLVVFAMLFVSCISTILTTRKMFMKKYPILITDVNYTNFSDDKNFIVFLLDAVDSKKFDEQLSTSKYKDSFKDFTYYPDTLSYYMYTRDSIPLILTGKPNHNKDEFYTYYNKAFDESKLIDELINKDYDINLYEYELIWTSEKSKVVKNIEKIPNKINTKHFVKSNLQYVGYKYLPYFLKKYVHIETMDFNLDKSSDEHNKAYQWDNIKNYRMIQNANVTKDPKKQFKFIHTNGSHVPYNMDEELNRVDEKNSSYEKEINASIKLVDSYINMLKENGVYDNSVIVIMADHGYAKKKIIGRQNPILYIKGVNEHHDIMPVSDKRVSHIDIADAFVELLNDVKTEQLFPNIPIDRKRRLIWYRFTRENKMTEYQTNGHAWENNKLKKTGRKYNR